MGKIKPPSKRHLSEADRIRYRSDRRLRSNQTDALIEGKKQKRLFLDDCGSSGESDRDEAPEEVSFKQPTGNATIDPQKPKKRVNKNKVSTAGTSRSDRVSEGEVQKQKNRLSRHDKAPSKRPAPQSHANPVTSFRDELLKVSTQRFRDNDFVNRLHGEKWRNVH